MRQVFQVVNHAIIQVLAPLDTDGPRARLQVLVELEIHRVPGSVESQNLQQPSLGLDTMIQ